MPKRVEGKRVGKKEGDDVVFWVVMDMVLYKVKGRWIGGTMAGRSKGRFWHKHFV